ncbi:UDP-glycosyltransferase 71K2 [Cicer arietinum]|uniref:Glycosyltransferase n=1 Tax=Cicer arietinum TaxID=3827 RepID=A0A067XU33_CICAR|nr:UDP-glycosyltransferase 71K2 [Cicer arietinum]AGU14120.1 UDP-glycosyltransferase [Cicer arietinum]
MKNKKAELIFIPSPGIGHLTSSLEFAKLLINTNTNLHITVLCINLPDTPFSDSYIKSVLNSQPQIHLIDLPKVEPPSKELFITPPSYFKTLIETLIPHVKATIQNILSSHSNQVVGLVLDFFCISIVDVGTELGIPSYLFLTSNVGFLGFMLSLQTRQINDVFHDSDPELLIPGFSNPVPSSVLPNSAFSKDGGYEAYYKLAERFNNTKGIIVNTFSELEKYAIDALYDHYDRTPPIYAVGPLIDLKSQPNPNLHQAQRDLILKWLDEQPHKSVVFLCFGSMGSFGSSQTREIALGLKHSGVRFLWAMRSPPTSNNEEKILPEGFLEWMEGKGMICEWAPQVEVLAHKAIGGFVSHCGWNSILESLWFGVPILTWPIYAEQQLNAFRMIKEFGLAVELRLDYRKGSDVLVAEEIEKGLKTLMDKDNVVHKKLQEMKEIARKAVVNGGSSFISVGKLIDNMIGSNSL